MNDNAIDTKNCIQFAPTALFLILINATRFCLIIGGVIAAKDKIRPHLA